MNITKKDLSLERGFTLIELLIVIGILAILAAIVVVAINPARQFASARNVQREANVASILNAIGQNMVNNKGALTGCPTIGAPTHIGEGTGNVKLKTCLDPYLPMGIPVDPLTGDENDTDYTIEKTSDSNYKVCTTQYKESALDPVPADEYCLVR